MDILPAEQINSSLIELGAQLVAFVGARDVSYGDLDAADDRLDVDRGRRGEGAHVARMRRAFPFLLGLLSALSGSFGNFFLYRINDGIGILSRGKHDLQLIPEPLPGS